MTRSPRKQGGFMLVAAIFLIVVMAALGVFMVTMSSTQHTTVSYAILGARAYHAARSGLEVAIARALPAGNCAPVPVTISFSDAGLAGYSADLGCEVTIHQEQGASVNVYVLTARGYTTGVPFGSPGYAARRLTTTVTDAP